MTGKNLKLISKLISHTVFLGAGFYIGKNYLQNKQQQTITPINKNTENLLTQKLYDYLDKSFDNTLIWPKYNINLQTNLDSSLELFKKFNEFGLPPNLGQLNLFSRYLSVTDNHLRIPLYVAWTIPHIDAEKLIIKSDRKNSQFKKSDSFDSLSNFNPINEDYYGSRYSRGHLANCGDFIGFEQSSMDETHLLAMNIVPQNFDNNAGYWLRMERYTRELAEKFDAVHVIAGPAFVPKIFDNNNKEEKKKSTGPKGKVEYLIIGENNVAVPTHLFRIIIAEKTFKSNNTPETKYFVQAFLVPNNKITETDHLTEYCISFKDLEKITGLRFLYKIEKSNKILPLCCQSLSDDNKKDINENLEINKTNVCASNCNLPPWQDILFQQVLWKKNVTKEEIEKKWESLINETNWIPSKDAVRRKKQFLEKLEADKKE